MDIQAHFQGLGHIAIHTKDMEESLSFYRRLGGQVALPGQCPHPRGRKAAGADALRRRHAGNYSSPPSPSP